MTVPLILTYSNSTNEADYLKACQLAIRLSLAVAQENEVSEDALYALQITPKGLQLKYLKDHSHAVMIDFLTLSLNNRFNSATKWREVLVRACGIKPLKKLNIIDATAGLGRDALLLASCGGEITMIERSDILSVLLEDALMRLPLDHFLKSHLNLIRGNSIDYLQNLTRDNYPDVIYLDPMYPERHKSALVKKELRFIRDIVGEDEDAAALFEIAMQRTKRVVVKRPAKGKAITVLKPTFVLQHERVRFDVYIKLNPIGKETAASCGV